MCCNPADVVTVRTDVIPSPSLVRLQSLLSEFGKFPAKYRCLIWRFLLRLPENHIAHTNLTSKGPHPAYAAIQSKYPLKDSRLLRRLVSCLSAIAHWSPVFGEVEFLPELAFPFVKIYGAMVVIRKPW